MLPNFLIIGAGKAGTTSLHRYLGQHPDIYVSPLKETRFFAYDGQKATFIGRWFWPVTTLARYRAQFEGVGQEKAIGEVCPAYLHSPIAAERIHRHIPNAKIIAILRDPAERAYSSYGMHRSVGTDARTFSEAIHEEDSEPAKMERTYGRPPYVAPGFYYRHLSRYFERFDRSRIAIYLFDELCAAPSRVLTDIFRFLEVDPEFRPDMSVRHNKGGLPKSKTIQFILKPRGITAELRAWLPDGLGARWSAFSRDVQRRNLSKPIPAMAPDVRKILVARYRDDILQLQDLIDRDLSMWLDGGRRQDNCRGMHT